MRGHHHINLVRQIRKLHRLRRVMLPREIRKILIDCPAVHRELARTGPQKYARDGFFAAARAEKPGFTERCPAGRFRTQNFLLVKLQKTCKAKKTWFETTRP